MFIPPLTCIPSLPHLVRAQVSVGDLSGLSVRSKECCWVTELEQRTNLETCCSGSLQSLLSFCLGRYDINSLTSHWLDISGGCHSCSLMRVITFVLVGCKEEGGQKQPCIFSPPWLTSCTVVTFYAPKLASGFPQESLYVLKIGGSVGV